MLRSTSSGICLRDSEGRGVGTALINKCHANEEAYGALCYPKCRDGYQAIGCCLCRQKVCPPEYRDDETAKCIKPASYGRGAGYPWKFGDSLNDKGMFRRCEASHGAGNCEKSGLIVYPKCRSRFQAVGCCICSPSCPAEMTSYETSCGKSTYGRGAGVSRLGCADDQEQDAGLCYRKCQTGFNGVGPVCWQRCPSNLNYDCGVMCAASSGACAKIIASIIATAAKAGIYLVVKNFYGAARGILDIIRKLTSIKFC